MLDGSNAESLGREPIRRALDFPSRTIPAQFVNSRKIPAFEAVCENAKWLCLQ